ncbi:MAG TPA: flagellar hook capping FlgD N-terminal domain-containing protein [Pirellulales bacterium]|jgi:flagellar basal-body rod modification protein FlgD
MASSTSTSTPIASNTDSATTTALNNAALGQLKLDDFLKMLLTELQNQDPLSPMDSSTMLTQIGQISQVGATQNLTSTLDSVLLGQNINNATSLIGKTVDGINDSGTEVTGKVDKVTISNGQPVLNIGNDTMQLTNVRAILPDATDPNAAAATAGSSTALQQLLQQLQQAQQQTAAAAAAAGTATATTGTTTPAASSSTTTSGSTVPPAAAAS